MSQFECSICFESLENSPEGDSIKGSRIEGTNCGHVFHEICLKTWLKANRRDRACPTCRKKVKQREIIRCFPSPLIRFKNPDVNEKEKSDKETSDKTVKPISSLADPLLPYASTVPIYDDGELFDDPPPVKKMKLHFDEKIQDKMLTDLQTLHESFSTRKDDFQLISTASVNLMEEKRKQKLQTAVQADTIRKLIAQPPCVCHAKDENPNLFLEDIGTEEIYDEEEFEDEFEDEFQDEFQDEEISEEEEIEIEEIDEDDEYTEDEDDVEE